MAKCAGCNSDLLEEQYLVCHICQSAYDLECTNINKIQFNSMTTRNKNEWKCQACVCSMPKRDNTNTPVRQTYCEPTCTTPNNLNVTLRRKPKSNDVTTELSPDDIIGDTQISQSLHLINENHIGTLNNSDSIILEKFSQLLDTKLECMKISIIQNVKNTIQAEFTNAINKLQNDLIQSKSILATEQSTLKEKICTLNNKIDTIEQQLQILENGNKIVLYGLQEEYYETDNDLYDRVSRAFYEIMNIDINPYIEEIKRIGKRGEKRPLQIDLISKRMAKYITENGRAFKNTGLSVGKFLDRKELQHRNELRKKVNLARKNGQRAYIKNNKLYINGKESEDYNERTYIEKQIPTTHDLTLGNESILHDTQQTPTDLITPHPDSPTKSTEKQKLKQTFRY